MAQHQWENEGCTAVHNRNDTIGGPVNEAGGGGEILKFYSNYDLSTVVRLTLDATFLQQCML